MFVYTLYVHWTTRDFATLMQNRMRGHEAIPNKFD